MVSVPEWGSTSRIACFGRVTKMMKMRKKLVIRGLYAITPDESNTAELLRKVRLALQGGAHVLQYRNKLADAELKLQQAQALRQLVSEFDCTYLVNDDAQ